MTEGVRINKALAQAGVGSRRQVERWIRAGRLTVNQVPAELGQRITADDHVELDGTAISMADEPAAPQIIMYHKPAGEVCTRSDPEGRPTVFERLPKLETGRWIGVGRLDINTSGLLLFTTDGELANRLMHPSSRIEREYAVRAFGDLSGESIAKLTEGVELEDGFARFTDVQPGGGEGANRWYYVVLLEGRQREVRRLFEAVGHKVSRLIRVRFGNVILERDLRLGKTEPLSDQQTSELRKLVANAAGKRRRPPRRR